MSRVMSLSVLCASHHMIGWCMYLGLWKCMQSYDKIIFYSSLPFLLVCVPVCDFLLLRWSSIYWCEQMREPPVVIRVMEVPLHSLSGLDSAHLSFLLALWPIYCLVIELYFEILSIPCYTLLLASWCALVRSWFLLG